MTKGKPLMALDTDRWTRLSHGIVRGLQVVAELDDPAEREQVVQIIGDNLDLIERYRMTGGAILPNEDPTSILIPFPH